LGNADEAELVETDLRAESADTLLIMSLLDGPGCRRGEDDDVAEKAGG
jgi:hypothetical protein